MYEIQKNIEMPKSKRTIYPFDSLEVGDGFDVPVAEKPTNLVAAAAYFYGKKYGVKLKTSTKARPGFTRVKRVE